MRLENALGVGNPRAPHLANDSDVGAVFHPDEGYITRYLIARYSHILNELL
jgi:hypothetical protein